MARPRSDNKRNAILAAATRVIASQGLSAATAAIAQEAGVSNGSLFTYFATKADLLNELYVVLKLEMAAASLDGIPPKSSIRKQTQCMWTAGLCWAVLYPEKRRALAHLGVSDDISPASHKAAAQAFTGIREILERSRENGPMRDAPLTFVGSLMNAMAEATIDFMIRDPANADQHSKTAFEALWRMIS